MGPWHAPVAVDPVFTIHNVGIMCLLACGFFNVSLTTYQFIKNFDKLNSLVKSFGSVLLPDILMVVLFFPQSAYFQSIGEVRQSAWCQLLAWAILTDLTALLGGSVIIAYTTYRLVAGRPLSDRQLIIWNIINWVVGALVAAGFWIDGMVGPYKNLYCCVRDDAFRMWAVALTLFFIFASGLVAGLFYAAAYEKLRYLEKIMTNPQSLNHTKASRIVIKRGASLVILTYFWWSLIIVAGFIRGFGGEVPASLEMFGAFLVKSMPLFDSVFLHRMIRKVVRKDLQVNPERDSMLARARDSNSLQNRAGSPTENNKSAKPKSASTARRHHSSHASRASNKAGVVIDQADGIPEQPDVERGGEADGAGAGAGTEIRNYAGKLVPPSPTSVTVSNEQKDDTVEQGGMVLP